MLISIQTGNTIIDQHWCPIFVEIDSKEITELMKEQNITKAQAIEFLTTGNITTKF